MAYLADTNVMWRRFDAADPRHPEIKAALDKLLIAGEIVYVTTQNRIEYQALATRPPDANGLGLSRLAQSSNVSSFGNDRPWIGHSISTISPL